MTDSDTHGALAETLRFLTVQPARDGRGCWVGQPPDWFGDYVFGGLVIAQASSCHQLIGRSRRLKVLQL